MSKKRLYVRPKNPADPKAEEESLEALTTWGMECKADFDRREAEKKKQAERGSSPPSSGSPTAATAK